MPVELEAGKVYWVGINSPSYQNFKSTDGVPAKRYVILFATKGPDGKATAIPEKMLAEAKGINEEPENTDEVSGDEKGEEGADGKEAAGEEEREKAEDTEKLDEDYREYMGQTDVRCGNWKAYKPRSGKWELYDLSKDIEEKEDVAAQNQAILDKLTMYAAEAHQPHVPGDILDMELCMKDHQKAKNPKPSEQPRR